MSFRSLGLGADVLTAISEQGYTEPTPIQSAAIPEILAGHDLIGIAQTGTGKTAAFTLPVLSGLTRPARHQGTRALVLAPTRELAVQIEGNVRAYGRHLPLRVAVIFGGVGEHPQKAALRSGAEVVIATPGRLLDLMGQGCARFDHVEVLVLDEADRMLDMGFLPQLRSIVRDLPRQRQTLLFSATMSPALQTVAAEFLHSPREVRIGRSTNPAETVAQFVYEVPHHAKPALLLHLLKDPALTMVLLFTRTKHGADRIARRLEAAGTPAATLHANRSQAQRLAALKDFKSGKVRVLVATDIASRGIDVDGISHVINFDFPMHAEDYVHRIGRTGRAQAVGDAMSFVTPDDRAALRSLEKFIGRGILRRTAEGFDPSRVPEPAPQPDRPPRHQQRQGSGKRPPLDSRDTRRRRRFRGSRP